MNATARRIDSQQQGPDRRLAGLLQRRAGRGFQSPIPAHTQHAFDLLSRWLGEGSLVLDSGCGKGESTAFLAKQHPDCLVVGVDRSAKRLGLDEQTLTRQLADNALLLRAELVGIWQLLNKHRIALKAHYVLYPNPYPKPGQLSRRWPAHPVFPLMCGLADYLEVRSNWRPYLEEWALSVAWHGGPDVPTQPWRPETACTAFERKYHADGQSLYRWHSQMDR